MDLRSFFRRKETKGPQQAQIENPDTTAINTLFLRFLRKGEEYIEEYIRTTDISQLSQVLNEETGLDIKRLKEEGISYLRKFYGIENDLIERYLNSPKRLTEEEREKIENFLSHLESILNKIFELKVEDVYQKAVKELERNPEVAAEVAEGLPRWKRIFTTIGGMIGGLLFSATPALAQQPSSMPPEVSGPLNWLTWLGVLSTLSGIGWFIFESYVRKPPQQSQLQQGGLPPSLEREFIRSQRFNKNLAALLATIGLTSMLLGKVVGPLGYSAVSAVTGVARKGIEKVWLTSGGEGRSIEQENKALIEELRKLKIIDENGEIPPEIRNKMKLGVYDRMIGIIEENESGGGQNN